MKYFIINGDTEFTQIDEVKTIEELKEKVLEIQNNRWLHLERIIWGNECNTSGEIIQ